jgi:hypothetical protein
MSNALATTGILLKRRPGVYNIVSISVANPTVITTRENHGLLLPTAAMTIAGTTTTPSVNGAQTATPTGDKTFTVPVNVTVGQATPAGTVTGGTLVTVGELLRATPPGFSRNKIETSTHNDGTESYLLGILRQRDPAFSINYLPGTEPTHDLIWNDIMLNVRNDWQFVLPSGITYTGPARVQQFNLNDAPVDAAQQADCVLTWAGPVVKA